MMAKIVKGKSFKGVINYVLDKQNAVLIDADNVRLKNRASSIGSFVAQAATNPR
jgi:DNA-binding protein